MAYKYITANRINSAIKKFNLQLQYTKGHFRYRFLDIETKQQIGQTIELTRMHHLNIDQWRERAAEARASSQNAEALKQVNDILNA